MAASKESFATLQVDPSRAFDVFDQRTGFLVRAKRNGKYGNADVAELDLPSLIIWLRSRGGKNEWAETFVAMLLGHDVPIDGLHAAGEPQGDASK